MYTVKTVKRGTLSLAAAALFAAGLCLFPQAAGEGARRGLILCTETLIPALFPMLFVTDYLFCHLLRRNLPDPLTLGCGILFSLGGGFPMGARALCAMVQAGKLHPKRASWLLAACVNAGPAFLITGVGVGLLSSARGGILLLLSLGGASLVMLAPLLLFTNKLRPPEKTAAPVPCPDLFQSLSAAVRACGNLCAAVVLFSTAGALAERLLPLAAGSFPAFLFYAAAEVSSACAAAAKMPKSLPLMCAAVSLCGGSVILQLRTLTKPAGLSLLPFLALRPLHLGLSLLLLHHLAEQFPETAAVFLSTAHQVSPVLFYKTPLFSTALFLLGAAVVAGKRKISLFTNG